MLPDMRTDAYFSDCGFYRYHLSRFWDDSAPVLNIIGLNPSTADATHNDPTIRRCIGFAHDNGFGGLYMTNLFAYKATKPTDLFRSGDPVGPENDHWLQQIASSSKTVLFAWGNHGQHKGRDEEVLGYLTNGYCLGINKSGSPKHPLYVRKDQTFLKFTR